MGSFYPPVFGQTVPYNMDRLQHPTPPQHSPHSPQHPQHPQQPFDPSQPQHLPPPQHHFNSLSHYPPQMNQSPASAQNSAPQQATRPRTPEPKVGEHDGFTYELEVKQSPVRARMCGFGDKDRRPITPPPCIRLIIRDKNGKEVNYEDIDPTFFVVTVDLWSPDAQNEINLVRHSATSPSISATSAASYPPQPAPQVHFPNGAPMTQVHLGMTSSSQPPQSYYVPEPYAAPHHQGQYPVADPSRPFFASNAGNPVTYGGYQQGMNQSPGLLNPNAPVGPVMVTQDPRSAPSGMFTRNLIGSLCVSAFKLDDPDRNLGIWFILQDLSVRTEGNFRLKFSFVDVGNKQHPAQLNTGSAPVLATCYSQIFQVFSAKKFPGVIESTRLSKCFAQQGIKIPIRKDGANGRGDDGDDGD